MKTLSQLSAANTTDEPLAIERGIITAVHDEPVKGFFRTVQLTGNALLIRRGVDGVAIPLSALIQMAEQHNESLVPPKLVTEPKA